jgi:hypothetical protein
MDIGYAERRTVSIIKKRAILITALIISRIDHFAMQRKGLVSNA